MSKLFERVSRQHPCPICGRPDWCAFGDRAMKCMRVESAHPCDSGGWFHFYDSDKPAYVPRHQPPQPTRAIDAFGMWHKWQSVSHSRCDLAQALGVSVDSLLGIGAAWAPEHKAWAFPMHDGQRNVIGIRLRNIDGFKWAVPGSKQGVFIPMPEVPTQPIAYLPEGPTDTAALLSIGLYAIGRPTCNCGVEILREALAMLKIRDVVIIGDNDELKRLGNREGYPGIEGALKLRKDFPIRTRIFYPPSPCKDVRDLVKKAGAKAARAIIESEIRTKTWSKK